MVRRYCTWNKIEDNTFKNCTKLEDFKLPPALASLGASALAGLPFKKITIPETIYCSRSGDYSPYVYVSNIEEGAFQNCENLEVVTFTGNRITCLRKNLFKDCKKLKQVNWGENDVDKNEVVIIEESAFEGCEALGNEFVFPSTLKRIESSAFKNTGITSLGLKNGNTILPEGLEYIGFCAFENCHLGADGLVVPSSVTQIAKQAFLNTGLEEVTFQSTSDIWYLGEQCFGTAIKKVNYAATNNKYIHLAGTFKDCTELQDFTMPDKVYYISEFCFSGTQALREIEFTANSVLYYLTNAFTGSSLKRIDLSPCTKGYKDDYYSSKLQITRESFANCANLTSVKLPYNLALVENGTVFNNCPNLERIDVAGTTSQQTKYTSVDGYLLTKSKKTLVRFPEGKARDKFTLLPPSIRTIGHSSFYSCKQKLTNVVIPNKVTTIEQDAFGDTPNLKTVTFLCDNAVDPHNISMPYNAWAFNERAVGNITLYVRKRLHDTYMGYRNSESNVNNIYRYFKAIKPSFEIKDKHDEYESVDDAVYKNEYINTSESAVDLISVKTNDYTYIVPSTVPNPDSETNETYPNLTVSMIGDYAFQDQPADIVKEAVVLKNVQYIGAGAFATNVPETVGEQNSSSIKRIFFVNDVTKQDAADDNGIVKQVDELLSTTRFKLQEGDLMKPGGSETTVNGVRDYYEFTQGQRIFVKKSQLETYQKAWMKDEVKGTGTYAAGDITIDYRIKPLGTEDSYDFVKVASGKKYSAFSREFDVDLGEYAAEKGEDAGSFDIKAFTMGVVAGGPGREQDYPEGSGETPSSTYTADYHLKMYHIGYNEEKDGTYIPNSTGALLAVMNDWNGTPGDYFYCIGEEDNGGARNADAYISGDSYVNGTLHRSVETTTVLPAIKPDDDGVYHPTQWVLQQGVFKPVKSKTVNLPPHKSWLYLDMSPMEEQQGAVSAPMMTFGFCLDDSSVATDIEAAAEEEGRHTEADGIYTITGVKVLKPETKGIYIINGKKHVIR